jgi:PAS domain S-box-containing protein
MDDTDTKLEKELKKIVDALRDSEEKFRSFFLQSFDGIALYNKQGKVMEWNQGMERITGISHVEIENCYLWDMNYRLLPKEQKKPKNKKKIKDTILKLIEDIPKIETRIDESRVLCPDNVWRVIEISTFPVKIKQTYFVGIICRDITQIRDQEQELREVRSGLEKQVQERTKELLKTNKALEEKNQLLEELNIALNVLLQKRENDKRDIEEKVLSNVKMLIEPSLEKIKSCRDNKRLKIHVNIVEANIKDIIAPFSQRLSSEQFRLTPTELEIANYIREGKKTKAIAHLMNLSIGTVKVHREHIRKKLGLQYSKTNLVSYLKSLA